MIMDGQFKMKATTAVAEAFPVAVERTGTANGGWEWFLVVGGERVQTNESRTGIFTDPDDRASQTPAQMLPRLLMRVDTRTVGT